MLVNEGAQLSLLTVGDTCVLTLDARGSWGDNKIIGGSGASLPDWRKSEGNGPMFLLLLEVMLLVMLVVAVVVQVVVVRTDNREDEGERTNADSGYTGGLGQNSGREEGG